MNMKLNITTLALLFVVMHMASYSVAQSEVFSVTKYDAALNEDITQAFANAWKDACASPTPSKVEVPEGTYKLQQIEFKGPCKAPIEVHVDGTILAPEDPNQLDGKVQWVKFTHINFFTLSGGGVFDGQGATAWKQRNTCKQNKNCKFSMNFGFGFLNNSIIRDITTKDSKNFHVNVLGCNNVTFINFSVIAPASSPNTDGIHLGRSTQVSITNSYIGTGDDCISLGHGTNQLTVQNVTCGPGHGISVGSLGGYVGEEPVKNITVRNCTLRNTDNGVRIKTWPGKPGTTSVSDIKFEDIIMDNVSNPIIIDQEYCPSNLCSKETPSKVKISNVTFKNIRGTSTTQQGVTLICSSGVPCEGVELSEVDLSFNGIAAITKCANVKPIFQGKLFTCAA